MIFFTLCLTLKAAKVNLWNLVNIVYRYYEHIFKKVKRGPGPFSKLFYIEQARLKRQ